MAHRELTPVRHCEVANASMLDESTSAAEAVQMCMRLRRLKGQRGKVRQWAGSLPSAAKRTWERE